MGDISRNYPYLHHGQLVGILRVRGGGGGRGSLGTGNPKALGGRFLEDTDKIVKAQTK